MAGHSHWAGIKHKKGAADAKRGKIFSKLAKFISLAARERGGDPDANLQLKYAIDRARAQNMPKDVIERAIKKGTGETGGVNYIELTYEGFGPEKVAVVIDALTDNRNRTAAELRKLFDKSGGNLGSPGSVVWMFETRGLCEVSKKNIGEEELMELVLDVGADDINSVDDSYQVLCTPDKFSAVCGALVEAKIETTYSEVVRHPNTTVVISEEKGARRVVQFVSALEDHEDVQRVSAPTIGTAPLPS